jgi:hypothetical protein
VLKQADEPAPLIRPELEVRAERAEGNLEAASAGVQVLGMWRDEVDGDVCYAGAFQPVGTELVLEWASAPGGPWARLLNSECAAFDVRWMVSAPGRPHTFVRARPQSCPQLDTGGVFVTAPPALGAVHHASSPQGVATLVEVVGIERAPGWKIYRALP